MAAVGFFTIIRCRISTPDNGPPKIRSVRTIKGNMETLRRYDLNTGELLHEHRVGFILTKSGNVRVFTFFPVGASPKEGLSYVYKMDKENFFDVPGLLHGDQYRNYQPEPTVWHWKRVSGDEDGDSKNPKLTVR